ncbi:hypothetical protein GIB67_000715 [Kingdonia uniflora]|uniref:Uncharacterized protein n=1 Tax=Kingdonia uniflora TaxID=39325 RepID=A0A7J7ND09_9MAGN|nr:hypothetical protein GIB67_000715 [Kingdonia uniflora]
MGWAMDIAEKMDIERAAFWTVSAGTLAFTFNIEKLLDMGVIDQNAFGLLPNVLPIGLLLENSQLEQPAGNLWPEDVTCLDWLDLQRYRLPHANAEREGFLTWSKKRQCTVMAETKLFGSGNGSDSNNMEKANAVEVECIQSDAEKVKSNTNILILMEEIPDPIKKGSFRFISLGNGQRAKGYLCLIGQRERHFEGKALGTPIRVDIFTRNKDFGYASVLVEIDFSKPMSNNILLKDESVEANSVIEDDEAVEVIASSEDEDNVTTESDEIYAHGEALDYGLRDFVVPKKGSTGPNFKLLDPTLNCSGICDVILFWCASVSAAVKKTHEMGRYNVEMVTDSKDAMKLSQATMWELALAETFDI